MKILSYFAGALLLTGCAMNVAKTPLPISGSRADGTVVLGYQYTEFEIPVVDWETASAHAVKRCRAWGYRSANPFEGIQTQCLEYIPGAFGGCVEATVSITYQCLK